MHQSRPSGASNAAPRSGKSGQPKTSFDRYTALAQTAAAAGRIIEAEYHYQHAEHYYRLMRQQAA